MNKIPQDSNSYRQDYQEKNSRNTIRTTSEDLEDFQKLLDVPWKKWGKSITRLKNSELHRSDIIHLKFIQEKRDQNNSIPSRSLEVKLQVQGVYGAVMFCLAKIENVENNKWLIGKCTIRLPVVSKQDGGVLARRSFDNLIHEVGPLLHPYEKDILTEECLVEILWTPNYRERIRNIWYDIKNWLRELF